MERQNSKKSFVAKVRQSLSRNGSKDINKTSSTPMVFAESSSVNTESVASPLPEPFPYHSSSDSPSSLLNTNTPRSDAPSESRMHYLTVKIKHLEYDRHCLNAVVDALNADLEAAHKTSASLETKLKNLTAKDEQQSQNAEAQAASHTRMLTELSQSLASHVEDREKMKRTLASRDIELSQVNVSLKKATEELSSLQKTAAATVAAKEKELADLHAKLASTEAAKNKVEKVLKAESSAAAAAALKGQADVARLESRVTKLQEEVHSLTESLTVKEGQVDSLTVSINDLKEHIAAKGKAAEEAASQIEKLQHELRATVDAEKIATTALKEAQRTHQVNQDADRSTIDRLTTGAADSQRLVERLKQEVRALEEEKDVAVTRLALLQEEKVYLAEELAAMTLKADNNNSTHQNSDISTINSAAYSNSTHNNNNNNNDNSNNHHLQLSTANTISNMASIGTPCSILGPNRAASLANPADGTVLTDLNGDESETPSNLKTTAKAHSKRASFADAADSVVAAAVEEGSATNGVGSDFEFVIKAKDSARNSNSSNNNNNNLPLVLKKTKGPMSKNKKNDGTNAAKGGGYKESGGVGKWIVGAGLAVVVGVAVCAVGGASAGSSNKKK